MKPSIAYGGVIIDLDEHFETPLPHRFLHGCLEDDPETCFTLTLPDPDLWKGRLVQYLEGGLGGNEYIGFHELGYYAVQRYGAAYLTSNHGHMDGDLSKIGYDGLEKVAHLSNYRSALCAREIIKEFYGRYPDHTYVLGGSGGGLRSTILLEKYPETYDGAVAVVQAELSIIFYYFTLGCRTFPILRPKFKEITEATDAGGTGDPYAVLDTEEQRKTLTQLYNAGFPRGAEHQLSNPRLYWGVNSLFVLFEDCLYISPEHAYYEDFWSKNGYAGHDGEVTGQIVEGIEGEVVKVYTLGEAFSLLVTKIDPDATQPLVGPNIDTHGIPSLPPVLLTKPVLFRGTRKFDDGELSGYTITFKTGKLAGKRFHISYNFGDIIQVGPGVLGYIEGMEVGDKYVLDNLDLLAFRHYQRHIVTMVEYTYRPQDFLRDGKPIYPQRVNEKEVLKLKHFQTGNFKGKMISIFAAQDVDVWPPVLFNYLDKVKRWKGADLNEFYRFYLVENATHGPPINTEESFRFVSFNPMIGRALDYIINWVENNVAPPPSTVAGLSSDYALTMPKKAVERKGIQPVIESITADGQSGKAKVPLGKPVKFDGLAEAPVGRIIKYEWYCQDLEDFYREFLLQELKAKVSTPYAYTFKQPGKYFAVLRVTGDMDGDPNVLGGGQRNLARIRVVVES